MTVRNDWAREEIQALYEQPFLDLVFKAQQTHREHFDANTIQVSTLLSIKTGKCPEDCKYCSQSKMRCLPRISPYTHMKNDLEGKKYIILSGIIGRLEKGGACSADRKTTAEDNKEAYR